MGTVQTSVAAEVPLFPSLAAMGSEHGDLLRASHASGITEEFRQEVTVFILRGQATGALLNLDDDRGAAQAMLDHWSTFLYRSTGEELSDSVLAEFDPVVAGKELPDEAFKVFENDVLGEKRASSSSRQKIVELCIEKIGKNHLLAIVGPAGSGRTSMVTNLVVPALKNQGYGSAHFRYFMTALDTEPLDALARMVQPRNTDPECGVRDQVQPKDTDPEVWVRDQVQRLRIDPTHLTRLVNESGDEPAVLVIDHFERVFAVADQRQVNAFLDNLLNLIQGPRVVHSLIFVMRSEYLTRVDQFESFQPVFRNGQVFVGFDTAELRQAILDRAKSVGLNFEEGLLDQLLLDVQGDPSPLTLLQFTLRRLWPERKGNWITWESYSRLGGGRVALERVAEALYRGLTAFEKNSMKQILLCLVQPGATQEVVVRPIRRDELKKTGVPRDEVDRILGALVQRGLVNETPAAATSSETIIALAHEALATHWMPLVEWLSELRDSRRRRLALTAAAEQWRDTEQCVGALWAGSLLQEALSYDDQSQLEDAFVEASVQAERKADIQQKRRYALGFAALFVIAVLSMWAAVASKRTATAQTARADAETKARKSESARADAETKKTKAESEKKAAEAARADAEKEKALAERAAKIKLTVANGMGPLENGDTAGGLNWFAEALRSDAEQPSPINEVPINVTRIAVGLRQLPVLAQFWHLTAENPNKPDKANETRPTWIVWAATFSQDGGLILTASGDAGSTNGAAQLFDTKTGKSSLRFPHDDGKVSVAALSHPSRSNLNLVATATVSEEGGKGQVQLWDTKTGAKIGTPILQEKGGVNHVAFSPDDRFLVMAVGKPGSDLGEAQVWDIKQEKLLPPLEHDGPVQYADFSPDSSYLITASGKAGGNSGWATIWDLADPNAAKLVWKYPHQGQVNRTEFSSDGRLFVTASGAQGAEFGEAQLWEAAKSTDQRVDWTTAQLVRSFEHRAGVTCAEFSPDNRQVVTAGHDGWVMLWNVKGGKWIHTFKLGSSVVDASFSPDGRYIVTAGRDKTARVWEVATGDLAMPPMNHTGTVTAARFSPDGRHIFTISKDALRLWEFATANPPPRFLKPSGEIKRVWSSEDSRYVITVSERRGSEPGVIKVWDLHNTDTNPPTLPDELHLPSEPRCAALSPNGQLVVLADKANAVKLWDRTSNTTRTIEASRDSVNFVAFSPDNTLVAIASGNISGSTGEATIWNIKTGEQVGGLLKHTGGVISASFSLDNRRIVTASADNSAQVWDVKTGDKVGESLEHPSDVMYASFSPEGKYVVTASYDQTAVIWTVETSEKIATLRHNSYVSDARFSEDGQYVVTASQDGRARVWHLAPALLSERKDSKPGSLAPELIAILNHGGVLHQASFYKRSGRQEIKDQIDSEDRIVTVGYYLPRLVGTPGESPSAKRRLIQVREWKLVSTFQTTEAPQDFAHLLSAGQINAQRGEVESLESKDIARIWNTEKESYRKQFGPPDRGPSSDRLATECEDTEQWFGAMWHLSNAISTARANRPTSDQELANFLARRARANGEINKLKDAVADATEAIQLGTAEANARYWLAMAYLADDNLDGYRKACLEMLDNCDPTSPLDIDITNRAVWACVQVPPDVIGNPNPDPNRVAQVAEQLVNTATREPAKGESLWRYLNTYGAALYRAGKYPEALEQFTKAEKAYEQLLKREGRDESSQNSDGIVWNWLWIAMVHEGLRDSKEARVWFNRAKLVIDPNTPDKFSDAFGGPSLTWTQKLSLKLLYQEAEKVVSKGNDRITSKSIDASDISAVPRP
jgi:WD40 repeat protein/tetratricopeptide (TPR) repeat protein